MNGSRGSEQNVMSTLCSGGCVKREKRGGGREEEQGAREEIRQHLARQ